MAMAPTLRLLVAVTRHSGQARPARQPELIVEIRADGTDLKAGDEIPIIFTVTNTGAATYE